MTLLVCLFFTQTILFVLALFEVWKFGVIMGCKATLLEMSIQVRQQAALEMAGKAPKQAAKN